MSDLVAVAQAYGLRDPNGVQVDRPDFAGNKGRNGLDDPENGPVTPRQDGSGERRGDFADGVHGWSRQASYTRNLHECTSVRWTDPHESQEAA